MIFLPGQIVHPLGGRRRYIVVSLNKWWQGNLVALSGAAPGCHPTSADPEQYELDEDADRSFTGKQARLLARKYDAARVMARAWGDTVETFA